MCEPLVPLGSPQADDIEPVNVIRVGTKGKYPRKILLVLRSINDCEKILTNAETTVLSNNIYLSRDRTFNQREEARIFRAEREKEERDGLPIPRGRTPGRPRGGGTRGRGGGERGRGMSRPRGTGGRAGRGSVRGRGARAEHSGSRKRRKSEQDEEEKITMTEKRLRAENDSESSERDDQSTTGAMLMAQPTHTSLASRSHSLGGSPVQLASSLNRPSTPGPQSLSLQTPVPVAIDAIESNL